MWTPKPHRRGSFWNSVLHLLDPCADRGDPALQVGPALDLHEQPPKRVMTQI